jgi:two-component system LytT family response regulator
MLKALIVDDEELARRGLEIRLRKFDDVEICGECRNGREAIEAVRATSPDIVFLDIQMPGIDGFEVLRRLSGSDMPIIVFVTAYDEFALKAFDANALDYLLKPINDDRLGEAIERARQARDEKLASQHRTKLLKLVCELTGKELTLEGAIAEVAHGRGSFPERLSIRDAGETVNVQVEMKQLEELLNPELFVRVHRSTIVNRKRVRSLRPHRNGEYFLTLDNSRELKLSRSYKENLERLVN